MNIWLIGAGPMAKDYGRALAAMGRAFTVVGRGEASAKTCAEELGCAVISGGLRSFLSTSPDLPECAIVAVSVETLADSCAALLEAGVKRILLEKPGGTDSSEIARLAALAQAHGASVFLAYNRRFYASVRELRRRIAADGGLTSFSFEFTEWGHEIATLPKPETVKRRWFLANSTHVLDTAFFLGGIPEELVCHHAGAVSWHTPAVFAGAGKTADNILFSYQANWAAPGRWGVECCTAKHRYYLRPMEQLQIQDIGSVALYPADIDYSVDSRFKPGLYLQVEHFLTREDADFLSIQRQAELCAVYDRIAGYSYKQE